MKKIEILHLYADTLDLYGDVFNLKIICNRLAEMGYEYDISYAEIGDEINIEGKDMVYIGHGKSRNIGEVSEHFCRYADAVSAAIENGTLFFVTGNARFLFGKEFETVCGIKKGIGFFDYTGVETNNVFTDDVVGRCIFDNELVEYGFINRTQYMVGENKYPLFNVLIGTGDGNDPDGKEGTLYKNFFGTWQMGPLLPRNPGLLKEILRRLTGTEPEYDDSLENKALELTLSEFDLK